MEQNVRVHVAGYQRSGTETEEIHLCAKGCYYDRGETKYLIYEESGTETPEKYKVTLKITADRVLMIRKGTGSSRLEFIAGQSIRCDYDTGSGILPLTVHTHRILTALESSGVKIHLMYDLFYNDALLSGNEVTITIIYLPA